VKRAALVAGLLASLAAPALADDPPQVDPAPAEPAPVPTEPAKVVEPPPSVTTVAPPVDAGPKYKRVVVMPTTLQRQGITLDLTLAGGVTLLHGSDDDTRAWFGRARAGVLMYNEPNFLIVGIAGQYSPLASKSLGIEAQYIDLWRGTWIQAGVFPLDTAGGVSIEGSVGYALLGVEYQRRLSGDHSGDQSLVLSLHIPLGVVRAVLRPVPGVIELPKATAER
jgi:hypothetical protein